MATYNKGILGVFTGKVGTVIGSNWKGIDYMRSLPKKSSKVASQKQLDQRYRFALINGFVKPLSVLIEKRFQSVTGNLTPMNAAVSYHLKEAITGVSPNFEIDLTKVIFSRGELLGPWLPTALAGTAGKIGFAWQNNAGSSYANADDQAVLLVYNPITREYVVLENAAARTASQVTLTLPATFSGVEVHCWMSYFAADGASAATSVYVGKVTVV
jgi:hypothetical protein